MKIKKIYIYGFGKLQDTIIDLSSSISVIQGNNEAGKSTIRAFIQAVLFGFPSRREKNPRYKPKTSHAYGGSITLELNDGNVVTVERTWGKKKSGDVTVYMNNGQTYGEEWLVPFLSVIDQDIFQGIFCFGLEGLSEIQQLKGKDLNQYIYEAGMTGTKQVSFMEKEIDDKLSNLFKPKGHKPIINQTLRLLKEKQVELRKWEKEFDRYEILLEERDDTERRLKEVRNEKKILRQQKDHHQRRQTMSTLVKEKNTIVKQLNGCKKKEYVTLEEEETWNDFRKRRKEIAERLEEIRLHIQLLEYKNQGISVNWNILSLKERLLSLKEKIPIYEKLSKDRDGIVSSIHEKQQYAEEISERLGEEEEKLQQATVTILAEEKIDSLYKKGVGLEERLRLLEEQFDQERRQFQHLENEVASLEKQRRDSESRTLSEKTVQDFNKKEIKSGSVTVFQLVAVIIFATGLWEWLTESWLIGAIMFAIGLIILFLGLQSKGHVISEQEYHYHQQLLTKDRMLEASIQDLEWKLERARNVVQTLKETLTQEYEKQDHFYGELEAWKTRYHIPIPISVNMAKSSFDLIKEWKEISREKERLEKEKSSISATLQEIELEAYRLGEHAGLISTGNINKTVAELVTDYEQEKQKNEDCLQHADEIKNAYQKKSLLQQNTEQAEKGIENIYESTGVRSSDEFLQAIDNRKHMIDLQKQLQWVKQQMEAQLLPGEELEQWLNEETWEEVDWEHNESLEDLEKKEQETFEKLAEINQDIKQLEEGGTYEKTLQSFHERKEKLDREAHQWFVLKTARYFIKQAKAVYEKERQPHVIQKASVYFSYITQNKYRRVFAPVGEERFVVENHRGLRFSPEELSRGTAEQLYLSLRLALAEAFTQHEPFPMIMDDPFVNFDSNRQKSAFALLEKVSEEKQIIYFTCHVLPQQQAVSRHITRLKG